VHTAIGKRRKRGVSKGKAAALRGSRAGTAAKQSTKETVSLRPGYLAEEIERSPRRRELLKKRFGKELGKMVEKGRDRYNLIRKGLEK
jgi:hypothetical protein